MDNEKMAQRLRAKSKYSKIERRQQKAKRSFFFKHNTQHVTHKRQQHGRKTKQTNIRRKIKEQRKQVLQMEDEDENDIKNELGKIAKCEKRLKRSPQ